MRKQIVSVMLLASMLAVSGCANETDTKKTTEEQQVTTEAVTEEASTEAVTVQETEEETTEVPETEAVTELETEFVTEEVTEEETEAAVEFSLTSNEEIDAARAQIWEDYLAEITADETRLAEIDERCMYYGDVKMKYAMQIKGDPGEDGYPLYIALHGGGGSDTPDINNQQWMQMTSYYARSVKNAIYINPRGVRDTWDTHANPESYPLYDRLIENMIAFYDVDPDKVYLLGYSAGGDGVYMITPKMADRFAAANMSAGHPNGINLTNLYNMPIQLQGGIGDSAYDRNKVTAEYDAVLNNLAETYGGGFEHNTFIHSKYGHNFYDNDVNDQDVLVDPAAWLETGEKETKKADTNAIHFLSEHTRTALPERVIWEFTNRANLRETECFYWLSASFDVNEGLIIASYDTESNSITIEENTANGPVTVLLNEDMLDLFSPITVNTPEESYEVTVTPDYELLESTTYDRGDENYQFAAKIVIE